MPEPERWLELADEDIRMAEYALAQGIYRQACFHSQQAVEKALKGFLDARVGNHPRSHSLEEVLLYHESVREELKHRRADCRTLDLFYLPTRYADALPGLLPEGASAPQEAESAVRVAKDMVGEIRRKMGGRP